MYNIPACLNGIVNDCAEIQETVDAAFEIVHSLQCGRCSADTAAPILKELLNHVLLKNDLVVDQANMIDKSID